MTNDDIQAAWDSPANRPAAAEATRLIDELFQRVRRRRRLETAWLIWSVVALTAVTALAGWELSHRDGAASAPEWAIVPLLIAPWVVILASWRGRGRRLVPSRAPRAIQEMISIARTENRSEQRRLRWIAGLFVVTVPLLVVAMKQLQQAGKVAPHELGSMAAVFGVALVAGAAAVAWRYFRIVGPEARRLDELLRAYGDR